VEAVDARVREGLVPAKMQTPRAYFSVSGIGQFAAVEAAEEIACGRDERTASQGEQKD
jgi:hypothetical protein